MSRGISWEGIDNFVRAAYDFEDEYLRAVKRVIAETAVLIQTQAQALAPFDEGALKRSIEIKFDANGLKAEVIVGVEYAVYLEFGSGIYAESGNGRSTPWVYWSDKLNRYVYTRGIRSQPFFRPAFEQALRYFVQEMNKLG